MNGPYSEKVMDHFMHPRNVGEIPEADGVGSVGNPICVSPDTVIFTNPDIKEIKDIREGTRVLSHDGSYHKVEKTYNRFYAGRMYSISVNNLGLSLVTSEHHILGLKLGKRNKFKTYKKSLPDWYSACELEKGDVILYPISKETKNTEEIDFGIEKSKWDFKSKVLPKKIKINNDFCRLVGYYLAEGYLRTDRSKGTIGFVFNSKEKKYINDVINLMKENFGLQPTKLIYAYHGAAVDIPFYSSRLARFFEREFGKGAIDKKLPNWAMKLSLEKQSAILCGMFRGDGYLDLKRQRVKYVTISKKLAYQLRVLLLRQRIISNFSIAKAYGMHKQSYLSYIQEDNSLRKIIKIIGLNGKVKFNRLNRHKSWCDKNFYYTTIRKIIPFEYKGMVCNLEVKEAHSYVSNSLTLHNCGDVMRLFIKIKDGKIVDAKFKTFGCGAAIATSSMVTEMVKGKSVKEALEISNKAVAEALGGLPQVKMHCSVLAEEALKAAIEDYEKKTGQIN